MSFTHTIESSVQTPGKRVTANFTVAHDQQVSLDVSVPGATNDHDVDFDFVVARLQSIFIKSDQDVTLETNSSSAPTNTIALKANKPLIWYVGSYYANLFTADVTRMFFTNAGATAARVEIEAIVDPTA
jgi:hypothetical protein